jgi:hypothetical protein
MRHRTLQRGLHLHLAELCDGEVEVFLRFQTNPSRLVEEGVHLFAEQR